MDTVSEFHAEAQQATAGEGLAQGPYVESRFLAWRPERVSNLRPFGIATNLPMSHHAPQLLHHPDKYFRYNIVYGN